MSVIVARSPGGASPTSGGNIVLIHENPVTPALPLAVGTNSIALGAAAQTTSDAPYSLAIGQQSLTRHPGAVVTASGRFQSSGDAQVGKYLLRTHTINDTPTELFLDGTGGLARLILPDDSTWTFRITVTGHRTDDTDGHAGYVIEGVAYRIAGPASTSFQGTPIKSILAESDTSWDINISIDNIHGALRIEAAGEPGKTIRWLAHVETVEITN